MADEQIITTCTLTNGDATVTCSGESFLTTLDVNDVMKKNSTGEPTYHVASVTDDETFELTSAYAGSTEEVEVVIQRSFSANLAMARFQAGDQGVPDILTNEVIDVADEYLAAATTSHRGTVELATNAETATGTATSLAVTPDGLTYAIKEQSWTQTTGLYIATDQIRAVDGDGLKLTDDGNNGIFVKDGGNVGVGTASPDRLLHSELSDATTNAATYPLRLTHVTTGTPANNIGTGIEFEAETSAGNNEVLATIEAVATDVTPGSEDGALKIFTMQNGGVRTEKFRVDGYTKVLSSLVIGSSSDPGHSTHLLTVAGSGMGVVFNETSSSSACSFQLQDAGSEKALVGLVTQDAWGGYSGSLAGDFVFKLHPSNNPNGRIVFAPNGAIKSIIDSNGNIGIGTTSFGTSAAKVLGIANGTAPTTSPADMIQIFSTDISGDDATLGLRTEASVAAETDETKFSHKLPVKINGTTYYVMLTTS